MPQMFAERPGIAEDWPRWYNVSAYLCKHHHRIWHQTVTPYMPGLG
jgi:hypothetical protein